MKKQRPNYNKYILTKVECISIMGKWLLLDGSISYLFYRSWIAFLVLFPCFIFYLRWEKRSRKKKRLQILNVQFKESIQVLLSGLEAGYSLENAFSEACKELWQIYQSRNDIINEFQIIKAGLAMNQSIELLLQDFGERSGLEDVKLFAESVLIVKRSGGNLAALIRSSIVVIQEKMEVYQEIDTILAGKKMEQKIMSIMPIGILFYVNFTSPGFFDAMYETTAGVIMMTICLLVYVMAVWSGNAIINVEV